MTETSWPFDNQDTTETQYSLLLRRGLDTGVIDPSGSSGGQLKAFGDSSGMQVKVPAGDATILGFYYRSDATVTLAVGASGGTARVDSVVLRLDLTANSIVLAVKAGTPGAGAPALTQTETLWEMKIADVAVGSGVSTIAAGNVTDGRRFTSTNWGKWFTATRPSPAELGQAGYNYTTGLPEYWDGSSWQSFGGGGGGTNASLLTTGTLANARLNYGVVAAVRNDRTMDAPMNTDGVNGNWDNVKQPGVYRVFAGNTNTNAPNGAYMYGTLLVIGAGANLESKTQIYFPHTGGAFVRTAWNTSDWGGWTSVAGGGSGGGSVSGSVSYVNGFQANSVTPTLLVKNGRNATLVFNCKNASGVTKSYGETILQLPNGFTPSAIADATAQLNAGGPYSPIPVAIDIDRYLRLRSVPTPVQNNASIYGTVPFIVD